MRLNDDQRWQNSTVHVRKCVYECDGFYSVLSNSFKKMDGFLKNNNKNKSWKNPNTCTIFYYKV